ncbi:unnamed protein product [Calypogeia fissa]
MPHEMAGNGCCNPAVSFRSTSILTPADIDAVANSPVALAKIGDNSEHEISQLADNLQGVHLNHGSNGEHAANGHCKPRAVEIKSKKEWSVRSNPNLGTFRNPIRQIVENLGNVGDNGKNFLSLAQGDPVRFGPHMKVPEGPCSALLHVIEEANNNGYSPSLGLLDSRRALAEYLCVDGPYKLLPQDVALCSGAAQALHVSIDAFRFPGCNILLPRPGFSLYEALCRYYNVEPRFYDLLEDSNWEVDLHQVAALADDNTAAMLVCNPGNPSGSVFSQKHMSQIATVADELQLTIIADEVYARTVFGKTPFVSMAKFSALAPVVSIGSISKGWLATGWRLGWLAIWDPNKILKKAKIPEAVLNIMQISAGPATPMQAALPEILQNTPQSFFDKTQDHLRAGADVCYTRASKIQGLSVPTRPEGSMFMMIKLDLSMFEDINSDTEFTQVLLREESVLVLPGIAFGIPNWFRIVFALSIPQLGEAWDRIEEFCSRHVRQL